ncbi:hypothetical protein [Moraxella porci]|uniref:hypothetical protein n=1 Tax=Moraxella porci TaxID=1288392 RepID=UPI00244AC9CE|nr:hypothetical protein [Moraxella porci]MDH2274551.1 hypothetical protein [Moraxella porci]
MHKSPTNQVSKSKNLPCLYKDKASSLVAISSPMQVKTKPSLPKASKPKALKII